MLREGCIFKYKDHLNTLPYTVAEKTVSTPRVIKLLENFFGAMREVRISENFQFCCSGFLLFSG